MKGCQTGQSSDEGEITGHQRTLRVSIFYVCAFVCVYLWCEGIYVYRRTWKERKEIMCAYAVGT